jgi:aryl-alcohol dehydrogenase-like predicted oxidoreductase
MDPGAISTLTKSMRTFSIPGTSLQPSVIGLGVPTFGSDIPAETAFRMLDEFAAAGGTLVDTAHIYAAWLPNGVGTSERTLGEWLKKSGAAVIVATKGGHPELATMETSRLSPECLEQDLAESLDRLRLDSIDLYFLHRDDPAIPVAEILDAMQPALRDGRIRALGASNWAPVRLLAAQNEAHARGLTGFSCNQCAWSLAEANPEVLGQFGMFYIDRAAMQFHREKKLPLLGYSAQAQGFFAQSWTWPEPPELTAKQQSLRAAYYSEKNVGRWQRAVALAQRHDCPVGAIVLAYLTSQDFPSAALIGPRTPEQLQLSLTRCDLQLAPDEIRYLEGEESREI